MQAKTSGIVLQNIKHSDNASIVTIYTRQFGQVAYIARGIYNKKSKNRVALLRPLTILEMEVNHSNKKEIQNIGEMRVKTPTHTIATNPQKNAVAAFVAEVLNKAVKNIEPDQKMYDFIEKSIIELDLCKGNISNFHLIFLARLSYFLGFSPNIENGDKAIFFDLVNGIFTTDQPLHSSFVNREITPLFLSTLRHDYDTMNSIKMERDQRQKLIEIYCKYYAIHLPEFNNIRSLDVLYLLFE